jgi:Golgi nucleoside diphosphatase
MYMHGYHTTGNSPIVDVAPIVARSGTRVNKCEGYVVNRDDDANTPSRVNSVSVIDGNASPRGNTICFYSVEQILYKFMNV